MSTIEQRGKQPEPTIWNFNMTHDALVQAQDRIALLEAENAQLRNQKPAPQMRYTVSAILICVGGKPSQWPGLSAHAADCMVSHLQGSPAGWSDVTITIDGPTVVTMEQAIADLTAENAYYRALWAQTVAVPDEAHRLKMDKLNTRIAELESTQSTGVSAS